MAISDAVLLQFQKNFWALTQQRTTELGSSKALYRMPIDGASNNLARIKGFELSKTTGRNPDKIYADFDVDNRKFTKVRFTKTIPVDGFEDVNKLIADPTSSIIQELVNAYNRTLDRFVADVAQASVLTGSPEVVGTLVSAVDDGVITVDATAGLDYTDITRVTENFINNNLQRSDIMGSCLLISGSENTALMSDEKFINNDYINGNPTVAGIIGKTGLYETKTFAGSKEGGLTVANPILPEVAGKRKCLVLAPNSIALSVKLNGITVERNPNKVDTKDVTIDMWIGGMRTEGSRVQIIETTI